MKTAIKSTRKSAASTSSAPKQPLVNEQPAVKSQAARQGGIFLHTDDKWSLAYFNSNDLHCEERELFG